MTEQQKTIHFVSLGCPKNRVDSEVMLGVAERAGYQRVTKPEAANVIVVNTCGFIDAAKKESIDTILNLAGYKETAQCRKLIVAGCLSQAHPKELADGMPEVDHFLGSSDMLQLGSVLEGNTQRMLVGHPADWVVRATDPRTVSTRGASAYVKIAEGCNRKCAFCIIPQLRGKQRSRRIDDIVSEVTQLAQAGVKEINLVSQDTVSYGRDLEERPKLAELAQQVAEVRGIHWVRLFYLYPETITDALLELLRDHPRIVPYVDMPLQHAADAMLKRMRRGHGGARLRQLVERLRCNVPDLVFRTAFIIGHPGESDAEFQELYDFVKWAQFDRVGVFRYSDEESSAAYQLGDKVPKKTASGRLKRLMSLQRKISKEKNRALIGKQLQVLVEGPSEDSELVMVGRHAGQAPEIDGAVYLSGGEVWPGQLVSAEITQASDYDLVGEVDEAEVMTQAPVRGTIPLQHKASDGRRVHLRTI
jgi:ribosomal protein S12 methylthiotransferase